MVLPVPGVPVSRYARRPGKAPGRPASRRAADPSVPIRSLDSLCVQRQRRWQDAETLGADEEGKFAAPCSAPRHFTTRKCRVAIWSPTRWSSRMTQSDTYSPARGASAARVCVGRDDGGDALDLELEEARRSSARRIALLRRPANSASSVSRAPRAWRADRVDRVVELHKQVFQVILAAFLDFGSTWT